MSTELIVYISLSLAWSAGCFGAGFFVGGMARRKFTVTHPLSESTPVNTRGRDTDATESDPWYKRSSVYLGAAVAIVGVITAASWWIQGSDTQRLAQENQRQGQCLQAYANGFADAIDLRSKAQAEVNEAQDRMWEIVKRGFTAPSPELRGQFESALDDYLNGRTQAKESPAYPDPPRDLCK